MICYQNGPQEPQGLNGIGYTTQEQQYYLTKLMGFDYEIIYKTGKSNRVADALSRKELLEAQLNSLTSLSNLVVATISRASVEEEEMKLWHN